MGTAHINLLGTIPDFVNLWFDGIHHPKKKKKGKAGQGQPEPPPPPKGHEFHLPSVVKSQITSREDFILQTSLFKKQYMDIVKYAWILAVYVTGITADHETTVVLCCDCTLLLLYSAAAFPSPIASVGLIVFVGATDRTRWRTGWPSQRPSPSSSSGT